MHKRTFFWLICLLVVLNLPIVVPDEFFLSVCVLAGIYLAINLMWATVLGTAEVFSFATLAVVGIGSYTSGYLSIRIGLPWYAMLVVGAIVGAIVGVVLALPAIRLRGIYFALFTLGLVQVCTSFVTQNHALGASRGLYGADGLVPVSQVASTNGSYIAYFATLALVLAALLIYRWIDRGRLGTLLRIARDSEAVAEALGVDVTRTRLIVFVVTSATLGLVGAFYSAYYRSVSPAIFDFDTLLLLMAMIVIGGVHRAEGVVVGTVLLVAIDQSLNSLGPLRLVLIGLLAVVVVLFAREGLVGLAEQLTTRRKAVDARTV